MVYRPNILPAGWQRFPDVSTNLLNVAYRCIGHTQISHRRCPISGRLSVMVSDPVPSTCNLYPTTYYKYLVPAVRRRHVDLIGTVTQFHSVTPDERFQIIQYYTATVSTSIHSTTSRTTVRVLLHTSSHTVCHMWCMIRSTECYQVSIPIKQTIYYIGTSEGRQH